MFLGAYQQPLLSKQKAMNTLLNELSKHFVLFANKDTHIPSYSCTFFTSQGLVRSRLCEGFILERFSSLPERVSVHM